MAAVVALSTVPWAPGFRGIDFQAGVILFGAALAYVTPAVFMAGWGGGSPLGVVGGFRWLAMMLAYAMPLAMVVTAVAAPAASLRPADIVEIQHAIPMALVQPLALALWLPAVLAVCFLPPFDVPQAPSELGGGAFAAYSGLDAALVWLAQRRAARRRLGHDRRAVLLGLARAAAAAGAVDGGQDLDYGGPSAVRGASPATRGGRSDARALPGRSSIPWPSSRS